MSSQISARRLYELYEVSGSSIREIAEATSIPKSAIQRYISGTTDNVPMERLISLAGFFKVAPTYVLGWNDDPHSNSFDPFSEGQKDHWDDQDELALMKKMSETAEANGRTDAKLNKNEESLNILLEKHGISLNKYQTKGKEADYGLIGKHGGNALSKIELEEIMRLVEDAVLRIVLNMITKDNPEWLRKRTLKKYGIEDDN